MKIKIEIDSEAPEEIIIRAKEATGRLFELRAALENVLGRRGELALKKGESECYLSFSDLLFFQADGKNIWAHTRADCFSCPLHLNELEKIAPPTFVRCSKGCIINTAEIFSLDRSPTGIAKATFKKSGKTVYISRMYYKTIREIIKETRLT